MKTYQQQTQSILNKARKRKMKKTSMILGACAAGLGVFALVLFTPYSLFATPDNSLQSYRGSEYYPVIEKIHELTKPKNEGTTYKNNFEKWTSNFLGAFKGISMAPSGGDGNIAVVPPMAPDMDDVYPDGAWGDRPTQGGNPGNSTSEEAPEGGGNYEETTDNQVEGVIEADLLKRSSTHAFYLTGVHGSVWNENGYYESVNAPLLRVYSIAGAASKQVESYRIEPDAGMKFRSTVTEMYLSEDCTTLTVFSRVYGGDQGIYTAVISLDVSDPTDVREISRVYLSGGYLSSRLVNGELLVINAYTASYQPDFDDESTFLPQYGDGKDMQSVAAEDIVCPDVATSTSYTVVTKLDGKTLEVEDSVALLSYSQEVYVSATNLFLTQNYTDIDELGGGKWEQLAKTNISCVNYADEGLQVTGTACVDGRVKNQYSMDEYENVLRVVTTYSRTVFEERNGYGYNWMATLSSETNANLYCIDLTSFERVASVEKFAPTGETAESVRFNGTKAYVCTAVRITFTDPVFFFDLSDLSNIKWTDTGTIDGYSFNLVDFGHGYLVGIGMNEKRELKIEVYTQGEGKVDSVDSYELDAMFTESYKSYLIDRKNGLIGLGVRTAVDGQYQTAYLLLKVEDGTFVQTYLIPHKSGIDNVRAFFEEDYLYLFGDEFQSVYLGE